MPTPVMAADLLLRAQMPGLEEMIADATEDGFGAGLTGALRTEQQAITKAMYAARRDAIKLGRNDLANELKFEHDRRVANIKALAKRHKALEASLAEARKNNADETVQHELKQKLAAQMTAIAQEMAHIKEATKARQSADKRRVAVLQEGLERAARSFDEKLEDGLTGFGDKFESAISQALSAENLDLAGLIKGGGQGLKGMAPDLIVGGKKMAAFGAKAGGAMGKAAAMLGSSAAALGAAAGVIAGAAAVLAAFVAVIMAAYGQTKEFNKAILEGSSAVDMLGTEAVGSANALTQELGNLRKDAMFTALTFRTTTEEALGLATAMNQTGFTFKEQIKTFGTYRDAMETGVKVTQAFGVGAGEYAEMVNQMTRDFAYGQQSIADGFGDIFGAAQMSGMGVKNFFTAISEATSGMALYNFRLEDTLELMLGLEKMLGEDLAKEVMGQLKGKYKGMGTQEKYKALMTSGEAGTGVIKRAAEAATTSFQLLMDESAPKTAEIFKAYGVKGAEDISKMTSDQVADLGLALEGVAPELALKVRGLGRLSRGAAEGAGLADRAEAMGELDQTSTLAMDMSRAFAVLGERGIDDLKGVSKMAFEDITGQSGEMLTAYQDIFARTEAQLRAEGGDTDFQSVVARIQAGGLGELDQKALEEAQQKGMSEMEKLANNQLKETRSILQTLKTGVVMMLELIYEGFFGFLGGESVRGARQRMEKAQQAADADPSNKELQDAALMAAKAYESVLQGGTTADVYEGVAAKIDQKTQLQEGLAVQGGEAVTLGASRIGGAGLSQMLSPTTLMNPGTSMKFAGLAMGVEGLKTAFDFGADFDLDKLFGEMSPDEIKYVEKQNATLEKTEKLTDDQLKEQKQQTAQLKKIKDEGSVTDQRLLQELGFGGDVTSKAELDKFIEGLEKDSRERLRAEGARSRLIENDMVNDFIYRGDGTRGEIFPINGRDVIGTLSDGSGPLAGIGRGVSINKIVVYESGDPQKTLAMIKQGVKTGLQMA